MCSKWVHGTKLSSLWALSTVVHTIKHVIGNVFIPSSQMNHRESQNQVTVRIHTGFKSVLFKKIMVFPLYQAALHDAQELKQSLLQMSKV